MPIVDIQRRLREIGRIRLGVKAPTSGGKTAPKKIDTYRFTSSDRLVIDAAAKLYGGTVNQWNDAPVGEQWEVITDTTELPIIIPPGPAVLSQFYELWSGGGCQRRCDGNELVSGDPCLCDPENRDCKATTRLSVILADLPGLGVWRVETHSYYAAVELAGTVELCQMAAHQGQMLPAVLRLEQRQVKREGEPIRKFAVPVIDVRVTPAELRAASGGWQAISSGGEEPKQLTAGEMQAAMETPGTPPPVRRSNSAPPIPATGIRPRAAAITDVEINEGRIEAAVQAEQAELVPTGAVAELKALLGTLHARDKAKLMSTWGSAVGGTVGVESDIGEDDARKVLDAWAAR